MIFVALGIIILVVSFLVAFVSLLHEQKKNQNLIDQRPAADEEIEDSQSSQVKMVIEETTPQLDESSATPVQSQLIAEEPKIDQVPKESFPWEDSRSLSGEFSLKDIKGKDSSKSNF